MAVSKRDLPKSVDISKDPYYQEELTRYLLAREEGSADAANHTYVEEEVVWEAVRNGNYEELERNYFHMVPEHPCPLDDRKKYEEYIAVVTNGVATRFAILGGASTLDAFALSDYYLKLLSKCKTEEECAINAWQSVVALARLVHDQKQRSSGNTLVEDCKKFIASHAFKKISLSDIAHELQVNSSYLSKLFRTCEGITITEYIHREKVNLASNMLRFSDKSAAEIATYLNFASPSYFCSVFKKQTGYTPQQFRKQFHSPDF